MQPSLIGHQLGKYTLTQLLGMGGMASVYASYQEAVKRPVAIKVLPPQLALTPGYAERFIREVELAASLEHPHILPIYDYGTDKGMSYIVMRLLTGGALDARIREFNKPSISEALQVLRQIGDALDYAHRRGIIHRDLKSSNVMFDSEGNAYLADFGIAKALDGNTTGLTGTGQVVGTPSYMSPEQWRGDNVDSRSDIYAFGVMAYDLLTGRLPFAAPTPHAMMYKHLTEQPPPPALIDPSLPSGVNEILIKALAKDPQTRYSTATEMVQALEKAIKEEPNYQTQHTGFLSKSLITKASLPQVVPDALSMGGPTLQTPSTATRPNSQELTPTTIASTEANAAVPMAAVTQLAGGKAQSDGKWSWVLVGVALLAIFGAALIAIGVLASNTDDDPTPTSDANTSVVEADLTEAVAVITEEVTSSPSATPSDIPDATEEHTAEPTTDPSDTPRPTENRAATQTAQADSIQQAVDASQTAQAIIVQAVAATQTSQANLHHTQTAVVVAQNPTSRPTATRTQSPTQVASGVVLACGGLVSRLTVNEYAYVLTDPPDPNVVRSAPGLNSRRIDLIQPGESFLVLEGPVCADDVIWWRVQTQEGTYGWTGEGKEVYWTAPLDETGQTSSPNDTLVSDLSECPEAPNTLLAVGDIAVVDFNEGGSLKLTRSPEGLGGTSDTLLEVFDNSRLEVLSGPICGTRGDRVRWYVRDNESGIEGWASEGLVNDRWMCPSSNPECGN